MTLRLRLGQLQAVSRHPLGTTEIGYRPGLTETQAFMRGRGIFKLNAENVLEQRELFVTAPDDTILAVATITGVTKHNDRRAVEGTLIIGHERVGTTIAVPHPSRNSVSYADEDAAWHQSPAQARWVYVRTIADLAADKANAYQTAFDEAKTQGADDAEAEELGKEAMETAPGSALIHRDGTWTSGIGDADGIPGDPFNALGYVDSLSLENLGNIDLEGCRSLSCRSDAADLLSAFPPDQVEQPLIDAWCGKSPMEWWELDQPHTR